MATGRQVIDYLAGLTMSGGDRDGEPFRVLSWEAKFCRGAFAVSGPAALRAGARITSVFSLHGFDGVVPFGH